MLEFDNNSGYIVDIKGHRFEIVDKKAREAINNILREYLTEQSLADYRTSQEQDIIDNGKVDKVDGKGLSTNDYTTDDKNKLNAIEAGAQKNPSTLPNPNKIKFTGAVSAEYDGSTLVEVRIPTIKGDPGDTPIRGEDYWTPDDIKTIKDYVDDAILGGKW